MSKAHLLGDILPVPETFSNIESIMSTFRTKEFLSLSWRKRFKKINQALCELIQKAPRKSFLLGAVLDYIERINHEKSIKEPYKLASFEFWLNNYSDLNEKDNYEIRTKIAGKCIPRSEYQSLFPIGMDRVYNGSHFVVAHLSPDIDAMVASFFGWLDAFAARVGTGIHQWCLPDGPPDSPFTEMFENMIGSNLFTHIARKTPYLTLTAMDMVTQHKLIKKPSNTHKSILNQEQNDTAIILVNELGHYVGDWRPSEIELASQAVMPQNYLTLHSDVEEMRNKIQNHEFLTVVIHELDDTLFPVGIVRAADLRKNGLGTVSFRDFCNLEEVRMSSYLEVISVMDHHKNSLKTSSVPLALIADVQSCNVLLAEQAFLINDKYSSGGMTTAQIEKQLRALSHPQNPSEIRLLLRLLQRRVNSDQQSNYSIHPQREYCEYYCFLQAILDDTDLLTKVSARDLDCIVQLLNRMKSLSVGKEVEIISLDDLPKDKDFYKKAAQRILQQPDMHSIYQRIYDKREKSVDENLALCLKGKESNIFLDTKEQNGCTRVGQTKLFTSNFTYFLKHANEIRKTWLAKSKEVYAKQPEIDLYIHMISTISSAQEVYDNKIGPYKHLDELWLWTPPTQTAQTHLNSFLANFQFGVGKELGELTIEFYGKPAPEFVQLFGEHFQRANKTFAAEGLKDGNLAVLRFTAGKLNSRKAMISPFLPRLLA